MGMSLGNEHWQAASAGAMMGSVAGCTVLGVIDAQLPELAAWVINTVAIMAVCWAMAAWKRAWYSWLLFWGMSVVCLSDQIVYWAGASINRSATSAAGWFVVWAYGICWYWLIRSPRRSLVASPELHIFHHVIHHGPGQDPVGSMAASSGPASPPKTIQGKVMHAIEAPSRVPGAASRLVRRALRRTS